MDLMQQAQFSVPREGSPETGNLDDLHSTFVQNVLHELRTPLGIILGYAELLCEGDMGALALEQRDAVGIILNRAYELRTLVDRTGILMAVEAHTGISVPLALPEIVTEVVTDKRADATRAGITLEAHLEPGLPLVSGDSYHLQQAIECLIENALKFTSGGGWVEVQVYASPPHDGGGECLPGGDRLRCWYDGGRVGAHRQRLLPDRWLDHPPVRRDWVGSDRRQGSHCRARREHQGRESTGPGQPVHHQTSRVAA